MSRDWRLFLRDVLEYGGYVRQFTAGLTYDDFQTDLRTQHATLRDLEVIGEAVKRLPEDVLSRHPGVPWRRVARFRDRLAHGYFDLDLSIVWDVVRNHLPAVLEAAEAILRNESGPEQNP